MIKNLINTPMNTFYEFKDTYGNMNLVNVNNIASVSSLDDNSTRIILNVTDEDGNYVQHTENRPYSTVNYEIKAIANPPLKRQPSEINE